MLGASLIFGLVTIFTMQSDSDCQAIYGPCWDPWLLDNLTNVTLHDRELKSPCVERIISSRGNGAQWIRVVWWVIEPYPDVRETLLDSIIREERVTGHGLKRVRQLDRLLSNLKEEGRTIRLKELAKRIESEESKLSNGNVEVVTPEIMCENVEFFSASITLDIFMNEDASVRRMFYSELIEKERNSELWFAYEPLLLHLFWVIESDFETRCLLQRFVGNCCNTTCEHERGSGFSATILDLTNGVSKHSPCCDYEPEETSDLIVPLVEKVP